MHVVKNKELAAVLGDAALMSGIDCLPTPLMNLKRYVAPRI